jgi:methionine-rich copper-binding protein CopC
MLTRPLHHFPTLLVGACLVLWTGGVVAAHARYVRSEPPENASLSTAPESVTIWFTELLDQAGSSITVTDGSGATASQGAIELLPGDNKAMRIALRANLSLGQYSVKWRTLSAEDGEEADGSFGFSVGSVGGPSPGAQAAHPGSVAGTTSAATLLAEAAKDADHTHEFIEKAEKASTPAEMRAAAKEASEHAHEVEELLERALDATSGAAKPAIQSALNAGRVVIRQAQLVESMADTDVRAQVAQLERAFSSFEQEFQAARADVGDSTEGAARLPRSGGPLPATTPVLLGLAGLALTVAGRALRKRARRGGRER